MQTYDLTKDYKDLRNCYATLNEMIIAQRLAGRIDLSLELETMRNIIGMEDEEAKEAEKDYD